MTATDRFPTMTSSCRMRRWLADPKLLGGREALIASLACLLAIFATAWLSQFFSINRPILLASMGASTFILFALPGSGLAQPWPLVGGHLVSGLVGVAFAHAGIANIATAAALTAGASVLGMHVLRCLHPPGVATALIPLLSFSPDNRPGLDFLLAPLLLNVALLLLLTLIINRWLLARQYPAISNAKLKHQVADPTSLDLLAIDIEEIEQVRQDFGQLLDVGNHDLQHLFGRLQLRRQQKHWPELTCGDIMQRNVITLDYASEVESAWRLIHRQQLKVFPVLDRSRRVIGIVTLQDFLKNLPLLPYQGFAERWLAFIKRTPATSTGKPEAIGHIMSRKVTVLPASAPLAELIALILEEGHRHVPIVDQERRFIGLAGIKQALAVLASKSADGEAPAGQDSALNEYVR